MNRKGEGSSGNTQVGIAIIVMAGLLLLGGVFFDDGSSNGVNKTTFFKQKGDKSSQYPNINGTVQDDYLFYLNETEIGRQRKVTESFPNIDLGSKEEFNTVYLGNSFTLNANMFTSNTHSFETQMTEPQYVKYILLYFDAERVTGKNEVIVYVNGKEASRNLARGSDIPIRYTLRPEDRKNDSLDISIKIVKPAFYSIFNWNKINVENLRVVEVKQNTANNEREFNFELDKRFLEDLYIDLTISCDDTVEVGEPIKVVVNGFIVSNSNPKCNTRNNRITANVSMNILNNGKNELVLETDGYYKVGYGITKKYYNDQETYKFTISSFNDIIDVVMYGDFDKEVIDVKINGQTMTLRRDEVKSIISYLKFGTNEIEFLDKPLEIKEFVIEKNEFYG